MLQARHPLRRRGHGSPLPRGGPHGYYLRIVTDGDVEAGDPVEVVARDPAAVPVSEITRVFTRARRDAGAIQRLLAVDALPEEWRAYFERQLEKIA